MNICFMIILFLPLILVVNYNNCEVYAFVADVGQGEEELEGVEEKAIASGTSATATKAPERTSFLMFCVE